VLVSFLVDDMSFKWTNDISITLIELYREFECLWNPLDSKYKCRNEKHGAWVRLSDATGADISEVKRKIKNLVAQFYRERRKYRQLNKSGAGATFISKWFAYKYLEFLADKNRVRQCTEKGFNDTKVSLSVMFVFNAITVIIISLIAILPRNHSLR
jgi:hypothetical protein